ncbi:MAG: RNA-binding domain-containing protein, partial [Pseudomonadota bacterium]
MTENEIEAEISLGEDSRRQFKLTFNNAEQAAAEMTALLNGAGGRIFIGVNDEGMVEGIDAAELRRLNQLLGNAAAHNVRPSAPMRTLSQRVGGKMVLVVEIPDGLNKPYCDNDGRFWVKQGADKRKVTSPEELQRLFQAGHKLYADEQPVVDAGLDDLDIGAFARFYEKKFQTAFADSDVPLGRLLEALGLAKSGTPTLAGLMLFGTSVARRRPLFCIQAACFPGERLSDDTYLDRTNCEGRLHEQFRQAMAFAVRNLRRVPEPGLGFNQPGVPEVPAEALSEVLVNALVHRDYMVNASVKLFIFVDRVEVHSPGTLPNNITVDAVRLGVSVPRNSILLSHAQFVLPYA